MGVGRFVCVAVPFALTLASLICLLTVNLAGVTNKKLELFTVNTTDLSISSTDLTNLASDLRKRKEKFSDLITEALANAAKSASASSTTTTTSDAEATTSINITAADLSLPNSYQISIWNYCTTTDSVTTCTKPKLNWAASVLNTTSLTTLASSTGEDITIPTDVSDALKTFAVVSKWTEVVYLVALITTIVELFTGFLAICSKMGSCCTFIISAVSTVATIAGSILATAIAVTVVGTLKTATDAYGVRSSINVSFLATTWLAVVFSLAGGLFWMFTICCCSTAHHERLRGGSGRIGRSSQDMEKLIPGNAAYQRVMEDHHDTAYNGQQNIYNPQQSNNGRRTREDAYEPYSHTAI